MVKVLGVLGLTCASTSFRGMLQMKLCFCKKSSVDIMIGGKTFADKCFQHGLLPLLWFPTMTSWGAATTSILQSGHLLKPLKCLKG